eukprot:scpid66445/ scgid3454/ Cell division control protein 1
MITKLKKRRREWRQTILIIILLCVTFWELAGHWVWFLRSPVNVTPGGCTRFLLVGDPQIQGYYGEPGGIFGFLTRWDVYSYLQSYVAAGYRLSQPDEVVFLGDLLDEGSTASDDEFSSYAGAFHQLFPWSQMPRQIFVAGDNDIGGEGMHDYISKGKVRRFSMHFRPVNGNKTAKNGVSLIWINSMALSYRYMTDPDVQEEALDFLKSLAQRRNASPSTARPGVLFSHLPLEEMSRRRLLAELGINTVFSAHTHDFSTAVYSRGGLRTGPRDATWDGRHVMQVTFDEATLPCYAAGECVLSVSVPTVSYRMGKSSMALSVVDIDAAGRVQNLIVLPLPPRYPVLIGYLVLAVLCCVCATCF